jgi:hypothetical protein
MDIVKNNNEASVFGHSLTDQISGQLDTGFNLTNMYEDNCHGESKMDDFPPAILREGQLKQTDNEKCN